MLLIRDVFRCKPGKARTLAEKFKAAIPSLEQEDGFMNSRVMVDYVASYWTVVLQAEVEDLGQFEQHMTHLAQNKAFQQATQGYMELVEGGHREIYRIL